MDTFVTGVLTFSFGDNPRYLTGLSDYQCNDPLGRPDDAHPIYCQEGFYPRNYPSRPPIPEVMRMENGDTNRLTEFWEWVWFWSFKIRHPSMSMEDALEVYKKYTRDDAAFTNKQGWNSGKTLMGAGTESKGRGHAD